MTDRATIAGNVARVDGGGMFIWQNSGATVTMTGNSSIRDNKARNGHGGGAVMLSSSRLTMMGYAVIAGNRTSGGGGGVLGDTVFMQGHSAIRRNGARWGGGAAISYAGAMSLQDRAVVSDNTATWLGGGILAISPAPVRVRDDAQVSGNHPSNIVHHADGFRPWPTYPYRIVVRRS